MPDAFTTFKVTADVPPPPTGLISAVAKPRASHVHCTSPDDVADSLCTTNEPGVTDVIVLVVTIDGTAELPLSTRYTHLALSFTGKNAFVAQLEPPDPPAFDVGPVPLARAELVVEAAVAAATVEALVEVEFVATEVVGAVLTVEAAGELLVAELATVEVTFDAVLTSADDVVPSTVVPGDAADTVEVAEAPEPHAPSTSTQITLSP